MRTFLLRGWLIQVSSLWRWLITCLTCFAISKTHSSPLSFRAACGGSSFPRGSKCTSSTLVVIICLLRWICHHEKCRWIHNAWCAVLLLSLLFICIGNVLLLVVFDIWMTWTWRTFVPWRRIGGCGLRRSSGQMEIACFTLRWLCSFFGPIGIWWCLRLNVRCRVRVWSIFKPRWTVGVRPRVLGLRPLLADHLSHGLHRLLVLWRLMWIKLFCQKSRWQRMCD